MPRQFIRYSFLGLLVVALGIGIRIGNANSRQLSEEWSVFSRNKEVGLVYRWTRRGESEPLHESELFASIAGNSMSLYRAQEKDPFGGYSRCGGFPCSLERGAKLGSILFSPRGSSWIVSRAEGNAAFLLNSICSLKNVNDFGGKEMVCSGKNGPFDQDTGVPIDLDSTFSLIDYAT